VTFGVDKSAKGEAGSQDRGLKKCLKDVDKDEMDDEGGAAGVWH